ncbi:ATP-binding domain-containing protein [Paenibacillus cymbidii]|uniref:ATP-binding domain-containing protein n=1 Tax=Paenibacillus cymbidii TaxID=1639034 RepID=UPI001080E2B8|nr:ATP-binding domain-containing protein [Paenibacillus cymbidii]
MAIFGPTICRVAGPSALEQNRFFRKRERTGCRWRETDRFDDEKNQIGDQKDVPYVLRRIGELVGRFRLSAFRTIGIVCKTPSQAGTLYGKFALTDPSVSLLDLNSDKFQEGVIVTSVHASKGLEFDQVIVPFADSSHYKSEMDRNLLYIACTRAMHALAITFCGEASRLIPRLFI